MEEKKKEEVYENLVAMYNKLNLNLMENGRDKSTKIQNIAYLGTTQLEEKIDNTDEYKNILKGVYVVEEYDFEKDKTYLKYYIDDMLLGTEFNNEMIETEDCKRRFKTMDSIKDIIEQMQEKSENSLNKLEKERTEKIANALEIDVERIGEIHEFNIDEEAHEKNKEDEKEKSEENDKEEQNDNINGINTREKVDLNLVFEGITLRNVLGLSADYEKIAIVDISDIKNNKANKQNGKYGFVGIKSNGEISALDENILGPDNLEGKNPTKEDTTIDIDGTVDKEQNIVSYKIAGKENLYLGIGYDESHGLEVKIAQREIGGKDDIEYELLTNRQAYFEEDTDVRNFRKDRSEGKYKANNTLEREEEHDDELNNDENIEVEDIDNIKGNETHEHVIIDGNEVTFEELATKWGYYNNGKPDAEKARKTFEEYKYNNPHLSDEELVQEVSDDLYDEYPGPTMQR